jgi:PAS domain S-box
MNNLNRDSDITNLTIGRATIKMDEFDVIETSSPDSDLNYRLLFEANPQPMWLYDAQSHAFLAVNNAAVDHYGYSRSEFLKMTIRDIRASEDVPELLTVVESAQTTRQSLNHSGSWKHRTKGGQTIDVEITSQSIDFGGRLARLVLATDVTEQKRTEQAKLSSETKFRLLFGSIPLPVFVFDQETLRIQEVNEAAISLYGYTHSEVHGTDRVGIATGRRHSKT